jgi:hypothetical protein
MVAIERVRQTAAAILTAVGNVVRCAARMGDLYCVIDSRDESEIWASSQILNVPTFRHATRGVPGVLGVALAAPARLSVAGFVAFMTAKCLSSVLLVPLTLRRNRPIGSRLRALPRTCRKVARRSAA